jgi:ABC-type amino acid transport substrate-binding protein
MIPLSARHAFLSRILRSLLGCALAIGTSCAAVPAPTGIAAVAAASTAAPAATTNDAGRVLPADMARIKARGEIVVAVPNFDSPPFFYGQGDQLAGIDITLAQGIANELGVKLRFNRDAKSFNGVVDRVANGEADLAICKLSRTLERAQAIRYSEPYLKLRHALALNRIAFARLAHGQDLPDVIRHFNGTLAVIAKSSFADFAHRNFPQAEIKEYPNWNAAVAAVKNGEVVATYRDEFEIKRLLKEDNQASLTLRTVTLDDLTDTIGVATNANDPQLLSFVNLYLSQRQEKLDVGKVLQALAAVHH